jgi:hypothetical protein
MTGLRKALIKVTGWLGAAADAAGFDTGSGSGVSCDAGAGALCCLCAKGVLRKGFTGLALAGEAGSDTGTTLAGAGEETDCVAAVRICAGLFCSAYVLVPKLRDGAGALLEDSGAAGATVVLVPAGVNAGALACGIVLLSLYCLSGATVKAAQLEGNIRLNIIRKTARARNHAQCNIPPPPLGMFSYCQKKNRIAILISATRSR